MRAYQPLKWDLQERVKKSYGRRTLQHMKEDTVKLLQVYSHLLSKNTHFKSKDFPIIMITIDNDFDGYSSAKQVYNFFSILGVSKEYMRFIPLKNHMMDEIVEVREQDLMIVTDASLFNINHTNEGTVWWIDHHQVTLLERMKIASLINVRTLITKTTNDRVLNGLSAGLFTHIILYTLLEEFGINLEDGFEKETKLDGLMSMISDMMNIEEYDGLYMGLLEANKPNFYEESKTVWDQDNKSYFGRYTSKINNLIRMERFDLVQSLIKGKGGEFLNRDINRMGEDRKTLMATYFEPLTPIYQHEENNNAFMVYQVPVEHNSVMRNHKGLLASMKSPKEKDKWITLSRVTNNTTYQYSVRTNIGGNLHRYLIKHIKDISLGGHLKAFGITIHKAEESLLYKTLINYINDDTVEGGVDKTISMGELRMLGNVKDLIWKMAKRNENKIQPDRIHFNKTDFKEIKVHQKRTVYMLEISPTETYEVVSFELYEKDEIIAVPLCKGGIFDKYKVDLLER